MRQTRRVSLLAALVVTLLAPALPASAGAPGLPTSMAAVGDSITRGYDASILGCFLADCPQYSWSTGTSASVTSHVQRIRSAAPGATVTATNVAKTGARMADLDGQLRVLPSTVQYVTVLIGANDICGPTLPGPGSTAVFESTFRTTMEAFTQAHLTTRVFVSSIPSLTRLYDTLRTNSRAVSTWRSFGICPSVLAPTADRLAAGNLVTADNQALARVCAGFVNCLWDGYATYDTAFTPTDVSTLDYFHPSVAGQKKLAAATWDVTFWGAHPGRLTPSA